MSMPGIAPSTPLPAQNAMASGLANATSDIAVTGAMPIVSVGSSDPYARSQADLARAQAMVEAWQAYRGQLPDPLKVAPGQPNDNVKTNRIGPVVDKTVSALFGKPVVIRIAQNSGTQTTAATGQGEANAEVNDRTAQAQDWLDGCLKANRVQALLQKLAMNGAVCGHAFLMLHPDRPQANPQGEDYPRITLIDPATVTVQTAPDDVDLVCCYVIEYRVVQGSATGWRRKVIERVDPDGLAGQSVMGYDRDDTWRITDYTRTPTGTYWVAVGESEEWPYPFPPIVDCQNLPNPNEYWGTPDVTPDIIQLNKTLNFVLSNIARILKYHAHPKTWLRGARANQIDIGVDGLIGLPSTDASLQNLEMQSDLSSSMRFATDVRESMDELSGVPGFAMGRTSDFPQGPVSGTSIRLRYQALEEKTKCKRLHYGALVETLCMYLLWIAGFGQGIEVTLHWEDLLPVDDLFAAQAAVAYQQVGVPQKVIWEYLGFDPDVLADAAAAQAQQQLEAFAQGQGMPPMTADDQPPPAPGQQPKSQQSQQTSPAADDGQPTPPVNHPAAVAQRNATAVVAKAVKAGARVTVTPK